MSNTTPNRANDTKIALRAAVADAYAMVKSLSRALSLAQATPEQMMQERILDLIGPTNNPLKPSRLDQVKTIRERLKSAIEQIRAMTPEELQIQEASDSQNSAMTPERTQEEETAP